MRRAILVTVPLALVVGFAALLHGAPPKPAPKPPARPPLPLPKIALLGAFSFEVTDAATGARIPAKLTFTGVDGTRDPAFTRGDIGREEEGGIAAYNRFWTGSGAGALPLPVGDYEVVVSRGIEWDTTTSRVRISASAPAELRTALRHVVDTRGWLSADLHVHAAKSSDSRVPMIDRVYEFAGDGVELIVSTDHNVITDYSPFITEAGLDRELTSIIGDELTTNGWGHFGAFPLPESLEHPGGGALLVHGRAARDFFDDVRRVAPEALIDVHHPRIDTEIGYFNVGQLDGRTDRAGRAGFSFDFDCLEVLNGYQDPERRSIDRVIDDWFSLLLHGHVVTATGNSDTHHLTYNIGGYPRNYVAVADDRPAAVRPAEVARALKAHRSLFTTGPFVRLTVGKAQLGDTVRAPGGRAEAQVEVQAAPWVSVSDVRVYLNGREVERVRVPPSTARVRLQRTFQLTAARDAFVSVRVDGDRPLTPVVGDAKRFTVYPLALTNPIFLDVDGNGRWDPPDPHGAHAP